MSRKTVAIAGLGGRMGQEILEIIKSHKTLTAACGIDRDASVSNAIKTVPTPDELDAEKTDVIIDFSSPELFRPTLQWARRQKKPFVSGTTGLDSADQKALDAAGAEIPVLWAPNMSLGVALVAEMMRPFSRAKEFDFQIEELHHSKKKDAPSGTALYLQRELQQATGRKLPDPLSIRGGGIFGIHRIWAMGEDETIVLEHTAMNRRVFARGAVTAAEWILGQKPGRYTMADVLGLSQASSTFGA